jgi:hypothetical protein
MPPLLYDSKIVEIPKQKQYLNASESKKTLLKVMDPSYNMRYDEQRSISDSEE